MKQPSLRQCHVAALGGILFFHSRKLLLVVRGHVVVEAIMVHMGFVRAPVVAGIPSQLLEVGGVLLVILPDEFCIHYFVGRIKFVFALLCAYGGVVLEWHLQKIVVLELLLRLWQLVRAWIDFCLLASHYGFINC